MCQARVIRGGIEGETGRNLDEFARLFHAQHHFASGFIIVAGGMKDVLEAVGSGTLVQEVENGLSLRGANGTGTHTHQGGVSAGAEPIEGRDAWVGHA